MQVRKVFLLILLIVIPVALGLYIRFDDLTFWNKHREAFYYKDRPLFTSYDAFYFARFGEDYLEGIYRAGKTDPLRFVPDNFITENVTYPDPIPMESWLGAELSKLQKTHIENVALWLTPVLAVFFVVPLVLYFYRLNLPITGFAGALLGVVSLIYLLRTQIVRFDTDSLNLFFPFAIGYFLLESTLSEGKRKYLFLVAAGILSQLYNWWYGHPGLILVIVVTYILWLFLFSSQELRKKLLNVAILILFANPLILYFGIYNLVGSINNYLVNFSEPEVQGFPNIKMSISELKHFNLLHLSEVTAGNIFVFSVGFAGLALLFLRTIRNTLFLLPIFLIGILALKGSNRFAMYLSPFIGIGFGYLFERVASAVKEKISRSFLKESLYLLGAVAILITILISNQDSFKFLSKPKITPRLEADFLRLDSLTPKGSWIWTWWDYGYAIQYLGRRATFHDGGAQGSPKTYFVATTFSTPFPEVAHNVITAVSNIGATGIKKLLESGKKPEEIRDLVFSGAFSAPLKYPVYWLFSEDEIGKFTWINFFGTWDFKAKRGLRKPIIPLNCRTKSEDILVCNGGRLIIDLKEGTITKGHFQVPLKSLVVKSDGKLTLNSFNENGKLYLEYVKRGNRSWFFLMEEQPFRSMFNQMYILRNYDKNLFELVYDNFPTTVLYRVKDVRK